MALAFFLAHWARCFRAAMKPSSPNSLDAPYLLPLLTFSFLIVLQGNAEFMLPWCQIIVCACLHYRMGTSTRVGAIGASRPFFRRSAYRQVPVPKY